ncbi:hypothetical protein [Rhodococcoides trifolii]|uniref:hypothetical protein n=1 Tax=Rhodococcoides trifolii TaxID=908250 RepID=UPI0016649D6B|nr:hypothetical protein [Rhodococcus trifolii]
MSALPDVDDNDAQAMAAMSCCPTGALVVLGQVVFDAVSRWWSSRRSRLCREREIVMLHDMWSR